MNEHLFQEYVGREIGGCRLRRRIGGGGMGVVFEAEHEALHKRVAVKMLLPALVADEVFVKRFLAEARMAARVEHPNVAQVLNVGQDGNVYFMVMQFIEGRSLRDLMSARQLDPDEAAGIVLQAARGLAAAHRKGIVHRDVKPENILIDREGVARVVDMGLSKNLTSSESAVLTAPGTAMGTPNYISPEQATEASKVDARADIYSLGATLYHAICGAPPFEGPSALAVMTKHLSEPLAPLSSRRPDVPPALAVVVEKMMAKEPEDRYQTMEQVIGVLSAHLDGAVRAVPGLSAAPVGSVGTLPTAMVVPGAGAAGGRRWPFVILGSIGTLAVVVILAAFATIKSPGRKTLAAARAYERQHPRDYVGSRLRYQEVQRRFPKGQWFARAAAAIKELDDRLMADSQAELADFEARVADLERSRRWEDAAKIWATFPAEFAGTEAGRRAAARGREAGAGAVYARIEARSGQLIAKRDWIGLEELTAEFPEGLLETGAGREAASLRERAQVAARAYRMMSLLGGNEPKALEKAAEFCDPGRRGAVVKIALGVRRVEMRGSKEFRFTIEMPRIVEDGKILVPEKVRVVRRGPAGRVEKREETWVWKRIEGAWYLTGRKKRE
ncbi:MAG: serine/threonine-protein kinase, partial [Planctomycetota bacterium]